MPSPSWRSDALKPTASRKVQTRRSIVRSQPNPVTTTHPRLAAHDSKPTLPSLTMAGQLARCRPAVGLVLCIGAGNFHSSATDSHSRLWVENPEPFSRQQ